MFVRDHDNPWQRSKNTIHKVYFPITKILMEESEKKMFFELLSTLNKRSNYL